MFAEERPAPLTLPVELFRYYQHDEGTVHLVGCVEVEAGDVSISGGQKLFRRSPIERSMQPKAVVLGFQRSSFCCASYRFLLCIV